MAAVIYHKDTGELVKAFKTLRGANASLTSLRKKLAADLAADPCAFNWAVRRSGEFVTASIEDWLASDAYAYSQELVAVYNNITDDGLKPIYIKRCEVGGPCDPSTERYWSM